MKGEKPFVFQSMLISGKRAGELVLGKTTFEEAALLYPAPPFTNYDGDLRPVAEALPDWYPAIEYVYNPWQTMYALFFDRDKRLVMVSELKELGSLTEGALFKRYPELVETGADEDSVEYQHRIGECVSLIATVATKGRSVERLSWAYTCE